MEGSLLKTGRVATLLGVSRQHVVNLCDRGDLPSVFIGAHRYVRNEDLSELLAARQLTPEQHKQMWLHEAMLTHLLTRPDEVIALARENIRRWIPQHRADGRTVEHLREWNRILDRGVDATRATLTSPSPRACELRQSSPFAGVLSNDERRRALASFRETQQLTAA